MTSEKQNALPKRNQVMLGQNIAVLVCPSSNGKQFAVTIDLEDLGRVIGRGFWRVSLFPAGFYCYTNTGIRGNLYLHRFVHGAQKGEYVDHIFHRTLDNRKSQTRKCSQGLNVLNRIYGGHGRTGYRGVYHSKRGLGNFWTRVRLNNKYHYLGTYDDAAQAAEVVNQFLIEHGAGSCVSDHVPAVSNGKAKAAAAQHVPGALCR